VVWVAVFQGNLLLASSGSCLKMEVVCFFRTVSISDDVEGHHFNAFGMEMRS